MNRVVIRSLYGEPEIVVPASKAALVLAFDFSDSLRKGSSSTGILRDMAWCFYSAQIAHALPDGVEPLPQDADAQAVRSAVMALCERWEPTVESDEPSEGDVAPLR